MKATAPRTASRAQWLAARRQLLKKEKDFNRLRDELSRERRALPWVAVEENYVFEGPHGPVTLSELFDGRGQLIVYHFMFGPGWDEGCPSCSYVSDHFAPALPHLKARDTSLAVVSRAPLAELAPFKKRMGWTFPWVSSAKNRFNFDYHVSFTPEEVARGKMHYNYKDDFEFPMEEGPGLSVFAKDEAGAVHHTYSTYSRGLDILIGTYNYLDLTPKGRDEDGLEMSMEWVRHHDRYGK